MTLGNTPLVLLGTAILGLAAGMLSSFVVLTRRSLAGDAVAHAALPGMCAAFLIVGERSFTALFIGAVLAGLISLVLISSLRSLTILKDDAIIAVVMSSAFGLGLCLSRIAQNLPSGNRSGLDEFIFGKAASMVQQDLIGIACVGIIVVAVIVIAFEPLKTWAFDPGFSRSVVGRRYITELTFIVLLCACTVIGLPAVGAVLMSALLIIPGASARFWTDRLKVMVIIAALIGCAGCIGGVFLSSTEWSYALPTGPMIVLTLFAMFAVSLCFGTKRGLILRRLRH